MTIVKTYSVYSPLFWKAYTVQMRPYLLFVSGIAGASGMAMSSNADTDIWRLALAFIPFFFGYGFGQALTDCFQTDTDKISAPYRPLSKGIVSVRTVLAVSIAGLLSCAVILYTLHYISFILSGLAVFGLATYSYIKKNVWAAGPFYNSWIVALLPVMGYFAVAGSDVKHFPLSFLPFIVVSLFAYASFVLIGYLKDIDADRATSYKTFPVVWGWKKTILLGDLFAVVTVCSFWFGAKHNVYETVPALVGSLVLFFGQWKGHLAKRETPETALIPILSTVRSFLFFHIGIVLHFQPHLWLYTFGYYLLFEVFLFRRPSSFQV